MLRILFILAGLLASTTFGQTSIDPPGVTVNLNGAPVLHRTPVAYPPASRAAGIEGTVIVDVTLDAQGNAIDARILAGPAELRRTVLEAVLQWHFAPAPANSSRQVSIRFDLPQESNVANRPNRASDFTPSLIVLYPPPLGPFGKPIVDIQILGLPLDARSGLLARLPVHGKEILTYELAEKTVAVVKDFDEHLAVGFSVMPNNGTAIRIELQAFTPTLSAPPPAPGRIQVGSNVQQAKLKSAPPPAYPALAEQTRIQGVVKLSVVIARDGSVQNVSLISGHPLLALAAIEAVKQWSYEPTVINGAPVEVQSGVDVPFALPAN